MPRWPDKTVNAAEQTIAQDPSLIIPATGDIVREDVTLVVADGPMADDQISELKFMEEPIEVMVHESTDANADNPVWVSCNGQNQFFVRGQAQTAKRKFVEILARAKQTAVATKEVRQFDGELATQVTKSTALRYPFSIVSDQNPKGAAWIKKVLSEG